MGYESRLWSLIPQQTLLAPGDESAGTVNSEPSRGELCGVVPELGSSLPHATTLLVEATRMHLRPNHLEEFEGS